MTGVTQANSNYITGIVTITALMDASSVTFATIASAFNALAVQAEDAISIAADVTTDVGVMTWMVISPSGVTVVPKSHSMGQQHAH